MATSLHRSDTETGQNQRHARQQGHSESAFTGSRPVPVASPRAGVFGDSAHSNNGGSQNTPAAPDPAARASAAASSKPKISADQRERQRNTTNDYQIDGVEVNSLAWAAQP